MFGRKNVGVQLSPAQRQQLAEAYRTVVAEVDGVIERCAWFLDESRVADVPAEYVQPLRETLEQERAIREHVARRIEGFPTASIVIAELTDERNAIHQATVAADDLMKRAGTDAAVGIMLNDIKNKR